MSRPRHSVLTVLTVLGLTMLLVQNAQAQPPGPVRTPLELAAAWRNAPPQLISRPLTPLAARR